MRPIVNEIGKPLHRKNASNLLDAAINKAQGETLNAAWPTSHVRLFAYRRSAATSGGSHLLGHKNSIITLAVYTHFVPQETNAADSLAASILEAAECAGMSPPTPVSIASPFVRFY